jgi:7-carboxy-7-deazaguanine synthase
MQPHDPLNPLSSRLRISEVFHSLQGESTRMGLPTVFVRLTGCPLRCQYCDTAYAFSGGELIELSALVQQIKSFQCDYICVTGGEPLAQPAAIPLLKQLCDEGLQVSLETSGARSIEDVDPRVMIVMDLKTPDSKECDKNLLTNLPYLKKTDQIKFVLCSRNDYDWACQMIKDHQLETICDVLFSPSWEELNPTELANWIVKDNLAVRFQIQLHKILWNNTPGH